MPSCFALTALRRAEASAWHPTSTVAHVVSPDAMEVVQRYGLQVLEILMRFDGPRRAQMASVPNVREADIPADPNLWKFLNRRKYRTWTVKVVPTVMSLPNRSLR